MSGGSSVARNGADNDIILFCKQMGIKCDDFELNRQNFWPEFGQRESNAVEGIYRNDKSCTIKPLNERLRE